MTPQESWGTSLCRSADVIDPGFRNQEFHLHLIAKGCHLGSDPIVARIGPLFARILLPEHRTCCGRMAAYDARTFLGQEASYEPGQADASIPAACTTEATLFGCVVLGEVNDVDFPV